MAATSMFQVRCDCGENISVPASKAGAAVACDCGRQVHIPSLSVLRSFAARGEVAPGSRRELAGTTAVGKQTLGKLPECAIVRCCGTIGTTGNITEVAIQNYVGALLQCIDRFSESRLPSDRCELVISCALIPTVNPWLDIESFPPEVSSPWLSALTQALRETQAPPVIGEPVGFAIYRRLHEEEPLLKDFTPFAKLKDAIATSGLPLALLQATGIVVAKPSTQDESHWLRKWQTSAQRALRKWIPPAVLESLRKKFFHKKQELEPVEELTPRQLYDRQEDWLSRIETIASEVSLNDLKREALQAPHELHSFVALATKYVQASQWDLALSVYNQAVKLAPNWGAIYDRRAKVLQCVGNSQAALADLTQAIELAPFESEVRQRRAEIYATLEAWERADEDLQAAQSSAPHDPTICIFRARVLMQIDQTSQATELLERALYLDPNSGRAHFLAGWHYEMGDEPDRQRAIEHFTRAIELMPEDTASLIYRSLAYLADSKYALALDDCERVLQLEPTSPSALGIRGRLLQLEGDYDAAIEACTASIEAGTEQAMVYLSRAISYASTDQLDLARADCEMAISLEPDNALARHLRGQLSLNEGELDAALDDFRQASELAPDWAEPREHLAYTHCMNEEPQSAIDEQTALIEQYPKQASHYVNRAFAYRQLSEFQRAAEDFDKAIELDAENDHIYYLRGCFRIERQSYDEAAADFLHVLKLDGSHDAARLQLAGVYVYLKQYEAAIENYTQLIAKYPDDPRAYSGRTYALFALGRDQDGNADVTRLSEIIPDEIEQVTMQKMTAQVVFLRDAGRYTDAQSLAEEVIELVPQESIGFRMRAGLHWDLEELVEAEEDYSRALEREELSVAKRTHSILSSRGQVQAEMGEWELALKDLDLAIELSRKAGEQMTLAYALSGRAFAYSHLDRSAEAERDFEESVQLCPRNPWVYYHRGLQAFESGNHAAAKPWLELALELTDPPLPPRKLQRVRLALQKIGAYKTKT